ncbi:RHS repeat-associated core domain-containing protein [Thioalkalivibrio sp. XN279]|uniref:RHS repeat-associated core domain-containing protein n=1 Tax=Thioalkalivibrio sp. XN279 TaxID=2714953 RepID=UPI00140D7837|nr:RHS repeat-associated core domain-containing protein [Thioalkalivibrio sp. XN279]NHA16188.1 hypothetical protein [Thioalkalivibrio sp. XN279]
MNTNLVKKLWAALLLACLLATPARAETVTYLHTDLLGSVVLETDQNRNVVARYEYEPYGLPRQAIADAPGYTGHVHDAGSGLVYMQQRYYDPEVGRFLSVDPVGVDLARGANFNRYWYGNDNPYTFVDPDGEFGQVFWGIVIGGAAGFIVEGYKQWDSDAFNGRQLLVSTAKGALVGAAIAAGTMAGSAAAVSEGAGTFGTAITSTATGAYSGAATNFVVAPAADIAAGNSMRSVEEYASESLATGAGAVAGATTTAAVTRSMSSAGASPGVAAATGVIAGEGTGTAVAEALASESLPRSEKFQ